MPRRATTCSVVASFLSIAISVSAPDQSARAAEPVRLTDDGRWKQDPIFLSGGKEVIYSEAAGNPNLVLVRRNVASGVTKRLHPEATLPEYKASFDADETSYVYLATTGNDNLYMFYRRRAEESPHHVKVGQMVAWHPSITPDGKRVFYNGNAQIRVVNMADQKEETFITSAGRNDWPAVSPDGNSVAFGSSRDGNFEIYVASLSDPANPRRLTEHVSMDMRPAWSPDGKQLAFTSRRDGNMEVYVIQADGSKLVRITNHPERDDYAAWHPDGKSILTVSERDGRFDLYTHQAPASEK